MKNKQVYFFRCGAMIALALLAGCDAGVKKGGEEKKDDAAIVQKRAVERWNLLIAHKAEKAYDYISPGGRSLQTREQYAKAKNSPQLHWQSVQPTSQECDADACTVHLIISSKVTMPQMQNREIDAQNPVIEHWVKDKGVWYYLPEES